MIVFAVGASGHGGRAPSAALALEAPGQALIVRTAQLNSQIPGRTAPLNVFRASPLPLGISTNNACSRRQRPLLLRLVESLRGHELLAINAV